MKNAQPVDSDSKNKRSTGQPDTNHVDDKLDRILDDYRVSVQNVDNGGKLTMTHDEAKSQLRTYIADEIAKAIKNELLQLELGAEMVRLNGGIFSPEKYLEIRHKELEARKRVHNV